MNVVNLGITIGLIYSPPSFPNLSKQSKQGKDRDLVDICSSKINNPSIGDVIPSNNVVNLGNPIVGNSVNDQGKIIWREDFRSLKAEWRIDLVE